MPEMSIAVSNEFSSDGKLDKWLDTRSEIICTSFPLFGFFKAHFLLAVLDPVVGDDQLSSRLES